MVINNTLYLIGEIGEDFFLNDIQTYFEVDSEKEKTIFLDSIGGDYFESIEMYKYLLDKKFTLIVERAYSGAVFIVLSNDNNFGTIKSTYLIHHLQGGIDGCTSMIAEYSKQMVTETYTLLELLWKGFKNITVGELLLYMETEKMMTTDDALKHGLINDVIDIDINIAMALDYYESIQNEK